MRFRSSWEYQSIEELLEKAIRCIDDFKGHFHHIAVFSGDWESHIATLHKLFTTLEEHGYSINPAKCEWGVEETDFLGHFLTPTMEQPQGSGSPLPSFNSTKNFLIEAKVPIRSARIYFKVESSRLRGYDISTTNAYVGSHLYVATADAAALLCIDGAKVGRR